MIALMEYEHLGLVSQPAECGRVDDSIAVAPERAAGRARGLGMASATAARRIGRVRRAGKSTNRHEIRSMARPSTLD
jgi:hypothetical protein